jgi:hypothetical protein
MRLALQAWRLREAARGAVLRGAFGQALLLARAAEQLCSTRRGESLRALSEWVNAGAKRHTLATLVVRSTPD